MCVGHPDELRFNWLVDLDLMAERITQNDLWGQVEQEAIAWNGIESLRRACNLSKFWIGTEVSLFQDGWPRLSPDESSLFSHFDKRISGQETSLHEQIRRMPTFYEKGKAIIHYFAASSIIRTSHYETGRKEYIKAWFSWWSSLVSKLIYRK